MAVTLGRSVIYFHSQPTAARFEQVWTDARVEALQLPQRLPLPPRGRNVDQAEPGVVVHPVGRPAEIVRYVAPRGDWAGHVQVQLGAMAFLLFDQYALFSCAEVFVGAAETAREQLPTFDRRFVPVYRSAPTLAGAQARQAARQSLSLSQPQEPFELGRLRRVVAGTVEPLMSELRQMRREASRASTPGAGSAGEGQAPPSTTGSPGEPAAAEPAAAAGPAAADTVAGPPPDHPVVRAAAAFARGPGRRAGRPTSPPRRTAAAGRGRLGLYPPSPSAPPAQNDHRPDRQQPGGRSR